MGLEDQVPSTPKKIFQMFSDLLTP